jgi:predicted ATPase/class 3 adenylate cyclase
MGLPTGTVTFLLTDIEGSTRLWEGHPDAMHGALVRHDALLTAGVEQHGGIVVKSRGEGDSHFAVFPRATDAVAAACAIQRAFVSEAWATPAGLRTRMALHTGEADLRQGDYYGSAVNRCARLRAIGHGGQTLVSAATQELARDALPPGASLSDLGPQRLQDLQRPMHVFQLLHPDLPGDFPPLRSLDALPTNLHAQLTSFIGREREMAEVRKLLGTTRLLTITGSGGCGKTRLAYQVAADVLGEYQDGVWLADLAPLTDPGLVPQTVAAVLDVREEASRSVTDTLVECLRGKSLLLMLDNCEHLLPACALLSTALLTQCPGLRILASSREALGVGGEATYRLPSLSLPDPAHLPPLDSMTQYEAVRLFIDRAVTAQPTFAVDNRTAPAVAQICHRLDGIPLAIELAAARVRVLAVEQISARLDDRFRLLTGGSRTALPRQQTLRAAIDWSYGLLTDPERAMLRRLSVFAGGCTLEAAETVCVGDPVAEGDGLDLLTAVADKSLVNVDSDLPGSARYRLLETVRQYARDRLAESGEAAATRDRHLAFLVDLAEEGKPPLGSQVWTLEWLDSLAAETDNVRVALEWSLAGNDPAPGVRLAAAMGCLWTARCYYSEGREWLERALAVCPPEQKAVRAELLAHTGTLAWGRGDYEEASVLHQGSLDLCRELGLRSGMAFAMHNLGSQFGFQGRWHEARPIMEQARSLYREAGDKWGVTFTTVSLGFGALCLGEHELAVASFGEVIVAARELHDDGLLAFGLENLGEVYATQGQYERAAPLFEESLALFRIVGDRRMVGCTLHFVGWMAALRGDHAAALSRYMEALRICKQSGNRPSIPVFLIGMAGSLAALGRPASAACLLGAGDAIVTSLGHFLAPVERQCYEHGLAATRAALDEAAFAAAWEEGRAMTVDDAIAFALEEGGKCASGPA